MVAAPYKVSMTVRNTKGQQKTLFLTASDVANEYWVFPSGGSELPLSSLQSVVSDIIYAPTYGTDTTNVALYVNGVDTGLRIINSANQGSTNFRQIQQSPIAIPAGAVVKFKQLA